MPNTAAPATETEPSRRATLAWVNSTYFAEGLPYMIVRILSSVFFTDIGAKERYLGYLNFLGIPWNVKFVWSPFVDAFSTKRRWLVAVQFLIALATLGVAAACAVATPAGADGMITVIAVVFVGMAFLAATNDISIDAYYLAALPDKADQAGYSGYRVMAYRVSMIFARSGLVALAAWMGARLGGDNKFLPWCYAFGAAGLTMLLFAMWHALRLPHVEKSADATTPKAFFALYGKAFWSYFQQPGIWIAVAFVTFYKLGDEVLFSMVTPFLLRELAITKAQYAWLGGIVGALGSIGGSMLGAYLIKQYGLRRMIWPLTLAMNVNIWAYVWLAWAKPDPGSLSGLSVIAFIHGYEQVAAGLGNAVLVIYLLRTCKMEFKAAHYAIGSAIMSLGGTLVGGFGGEIVESVGYVWLFVIGFVASLPAMAMLPWLPRLDD